MKKHIVIAGVPRAGKSTLSAQISKRFGYQHISMDSIIAGFETCFPDTGVSTYQGLSSMETLKIISKKMAPFLQSMIDSGEYDEQEYGMVIDMYQLLPEDYTNHIDPTRCEILYLVTADVTPEERFQLQKKYDTPRDYTYYKTDEELREGAEYIVEQSRLMKEQCEKYGLPCFETSRSRDTVLEEILQSLSRE